MFINIHIWKNENGKKDYSSILRNITISTYEELENDLIIYLENETNVYELIIDENSNVIQFSLREEKRIVEYYICLDEATEEEKNKIKKLVLDYYREVML